MDQIDGAGIRVVAGTPCLRTRHDSFTTDECGRGLLVYRARDYEAITGDPLFDPNRHTRVQRFGYGADSAPRFGAPVVVGALGG